MKSGRFHLTETLIIFNKNNFQFRIQTKITFKLNGIGFNSLNKSLKLTLTHANSH